MNRQEQREPQKLLHDLAGCQVPDHAVDATGAEHTAHRTAHLGTDADGPPVTIPFAQEHTLDPLAVGEFEQQFLSAVVGPLVDGHRRGPDPKVGLEVAPQTTRQVGHVCE